MRLAPPDVPALVLPDLPALTSASGPQSQPVVSQPAEPAPPLLVPSQPQPYETAREVIIEAESLPAPALPLTVALPAPKTSYHADRGARRMLAKFGSVDLVMVTQNPADGCLYEVPLCIPGCCIGEPTVSSRRGIFGRGVVEYCWPNGFTARITFRQVRGDVKVTYSG